VFKHNSYRKLVKSDTLSGQRSLPKTQKVEVMDMEESKNLNDQELENQEAETGAEESQENKQPTVDELLAQLAQERAEKEKNKVALDKALREASEKTKALRAKQTAEEQEDEAKREQEELHKQYVAGLERRISLEESTSRYLDMGMDKKMAKETAEAEVDKTDGYADIVSANIKKLMDSKIKAAEADWIKSRPDVQAGNGDESEVDPFLKGFGE